MPQKRIYIENGIYMVTIKTYKNTKYFSADINSDNLLKVIFYCREKMPFKLYSFCVLPNHIHLLVQVCKQNNISDIVRHIKGRYSRLYGYDKVKIWQDSFYDRVIDNDNKFYNAVNYIETNPCKHNYVNDPNVWKWSSINYVLNECDVLEQG